MPRLFLAVKIPPAPELVAILRELETLRDPLSLVASENLHVTLKFLGETPRERIDDLQQVVRDVSQRHSRFDAKLLGLGAFPRLERPSVLWCGLTPAEPFQKLAADLEEAVEPFGFEPESRRFHPHLTLARVKGPVSSALRKLWLSRQQTEFGTVAIDAVTLFESQLSPGGAKYTELVTAPLM